MHDFGFRVRWNDCDPYGHVNHATYLAYLETARIEAMDSVGWTMTRLGDAGFRVVVAEIAVRFLESARFDDRLIVSSRIEDLRRASSVWHQMIRKDGTTIATARVLAATIDARGRPARTPPGLVAALSGLVTTAADPAGA